MKTREEVEKLKRNWLDDPCYDIEETEGFEEYRDELFDFSEKQKIIANEIWEKKRKQMIQNASVFPLDHADIETLAPYNGLTKRELFAAMAMKGLVNAQYYTLGNGELEALSERAVYLADTLIKELNKTK